MNRKYIGFYVVTGIVILAVLTLLISKYYFDWFRPETTKYVKYVPQPAEVQVAQMSEPVAVEDEKNVPAEKEDLSLKPAAVTAAPAAKEVSVPKKPVPKTPLPPQKYSGNTEKTVRNGEKTTPVKTASVSNKETPQISSAEEKIKEFHFQLNQQNFHSLGEYVSLEEQEYRTELIGQLTINTIVIDKLSHGNGISQEFFRVAYVEKMIPSKVLKDIVESKEFRDLIPQEYLSREGKTAKDLKTGEKVTFNAFAIKKLLELWSEGKLTPVQKAWLVGADGRMFE